MLFCVIGQNIPALSVATAELRLGDPRGPRTQIGPLVSEKQCALEEKYVDIGINEGATPVVDGKRPSGQQFEKGHYCLPTIFTNVTSDMRIGQEEIFRLRRWLFPLIPKTKLTAWSLTWQPVSGRSISHAHTAWHNRLNRGVVWLTDHHRIGSASPWGGFKMSGLGRESGLVAYQTYTEIENLIVNLSDEPFDWYADDGQPKRHS